MKRLLLVFTFVPFLLLPVLINAQTIDFGLICVDSVWYEPLDSNYINVKVFNGNTEYLNYPRVQILSPSGDTISNVNDLFGFFGQPGNSYQTYKDSIIVQGITNFSEYSFLMNIALPDASAEIEWCIATAISTLSQHLIGIYPNPAQDYLFVRGDFTNEEADATIYNSFGQIVSRKQLTSSDEQMINISQLPTGIYFLLLNDRDRRLPFKFVKQ